MEEMRLHRPVALEVAILLVLAAGPASAYIDPGTGSLIFQFAAASLLGLLSMLKTYWCG